MGVACRYQFARGHVTKSHKLSGSDNRNVSSHSFGGRKLRSWGHGVSRAMLPLTTMGMAPSQASLRLLAAPWLVATSLSARTSLRMVLPPVHVWVQISPFYKDAVLLA